MRLHPPHSWFPFILAGLTVSLFLAVVAWVGPQGASVTVDEETGEVVTNEDYQTELTTELEAYTEGAQAAGAVYDDLIDMTVPAGYKDLHLDLVIAFGFLKAGDAVEGGARLDVLRQEYPWLP